MRALPNRREAPLIGALRAVSTRKAPGRPKLSVLTCFAIESRSDSIASR